MPVPAPWAGRGSGLIVVTGLIVAPLVRRRQALVNQREAAIARVSGHVADSLTHMETVRAFAAKDHEAAEHKTRVAEQRMLAIRSWDYATSASTPWSRRCRCSPTHSACCSPSTSAAGSSAWKPSW